MVSSTEQAKQQFISFVYCTLPGMCHAINDSSMFPVASIFTQVVYLYVLHILLSQGFSFFLCT